MKKRIGALLLSCAMTVTLLTGCGGSGSTGDSSAAGTAAGAADTANTQEFTLDLPTEITADPVSYITDGTITQDATVFTVDGTDIPASYYFYWLAYYTDLMKMQYSYYGQELDLSQEDSDGVTQADSLKEMALNSVRSTVALENKLEEYDLSLTDEQLETAESAGTQQTPEMLVYLCTTPEDQIRITKQYYASTLIKDHLYGEGGELAPTEETLADYMKDNDISYVCRYVLCYADTDSTDEEKEEAKANAQEIYDALQGLEGDELLTTFEEYQENNTDGNTDEFTVTGDSSLVDGFTDALDELEVGEVGMSGLTDYGYFVLLRLDASNDYIDDAFSSQLSGWAEATELTNSKLYDNLDALTFCTDLLAMQDIIDEAYSAANADSSASAQ